MSRSRSSMEPVDIDQNQNQNQYQYQYPYPANQTMDEEERPIMSGAARANHSVWLRRISSWYKRKLAFDVVNSSVFIIIFAVGRQLLTRLAPVLFPLTALLSWINIKLIRDRQKLLRPDMKKKGDVDLGNQFLVALAITTAVIGSFFWSSIISPIIFTAAFAYSTLAQLGFSISSFLDARRWIRSGEPERAQQAKREAVDRLVGFFVGATVTLGVVALLIVGNGFVGALLGISATVAGLIVSVKDYLRSRKESDAAVSEALGIHSEQDASSDEHGQDIESQLLLPAAQYGQSDTRPLGPSAASSVAGLPSSPAAAPMMAPDGRVVNVQLDLQAVDLPPISVEQSSATSFPQQGTAGNSDNVISSRLSRAANQSSVSPAPASSQVRMRQPILRESVIAPSLGASASMFSPISTKGDATNSRHVSPPPTVEESKSASNKHLRSSSR